MLHVKDGGGWWEIIWVAWLPVPRLRFALFYFLLLPWLRCVLFFFTPIFLVLRPHIFMEASSPWDYKTVTCVMEYR